MSQRPDPDFYLTLERKGVAELKEKGSRFIGLAFPVTDEVAIKSLIKDAKVDYPGATHYCYAWKLGTDGYKFRSSDDGEPSGSAGKPILSQLLSRQLTDVLIIVVRYYGGTMLGVPGLIAAYKNVAALALQMSPVKRVPLLQWYELQYDYTRANEVMTLIKQHQADIRLHEQSLFITLQAGIPAKAENSWRHQLQEMHYVAVRKL